MALRVNRNVHIDAENVVLPGKNAVTKLGCRPRTALGDIGNKVAVPKVTLKKGVEPAAEVKHVQRKTSKSDAVPEKIEVKQKKEVKVPAAQSPMEISCIVEEELCQAFSDVLLQVKDVDADDAGNTMLCSEYVKEIYDYLRQLEAEQPIKPHYLDGQEITGGMRAILVDWLVLVQTKFRLLQETMYMTVAIIDRYLQIHPVPKRTLQLVGVTAMFIASKYEEMYPPEIEDFTTVTDNTYTKAQVREMERRILQELDFNLSRPLPLHFLRRASKIGEVNSEQHTLSKYLMELAMVDYDMVHFPPSAVAAAAFRLAQKVFSAGDWTPTLQHYTHYTECDLVPIMQHMAKNVVKVNEGLSKQTTVKNKYASSKQSKISTIPQLKSAAIKELAKPFVSQK
ncbi:G2/mitotic-specific cyclin-B1 isoform X2 [Protopterus annectens]|uniref:G2/mitotic-specific cyclin-B1 isoform X2 n=1 Tax=Protopterus annectens TaxID=7888 RepID=UPI001CFA644C|nr:G2/mitotic-specific cyclin-B1 isoform X2 [Protopterus annectens]